MPVEEVDDDAQTRLRELTTRLTQHADCRATELEARWVAGRPDSRYLERFCDDVEERLSSALLDEVRRATGRDRLDDEIERHLRFARERAGVFVGRKREVLAVMKYIGGKARSPFAIFGDPGSGKSALLATILEKVGRQFSELAIVYRSIGATPASSNGVNLLNSLCRQIARIQGRKPAGPFGDLVSA